MGSIINTNKFLRTSLFCNGDWKSQDNQYLVVPMHTHTYRDPHLCSTLKAHILPGLCAPVSWDAWRLALDALWLLVLSVLGRRLKSAGALLMELLSTASHRHNFVMR